MRVAIFLPSGNLGGAEQVLLQIANRYSVNGANVTVIVLTNQSLEKLEGKLNLQNITLVYMNAKRESMGAIKLLFWTVKARKLCCFDYTYSSLVHINAFISILRKLTLIKIGKHIVRESTLIFNRFSGYRLKLFSFSYDIGYGNADLVICQTELMRQQLILHKPRINSSKMKVISNPITPLSPGYIFSNPLPLKRYIVSAGRLIDEKGFDVLIDSFAGLLQEFPDMELVILGEGSRRESLQFQIDKLGLGGKIHLLGWVDDVYSYFKFAQVCVVSSRIEGFPNVLLQMMMVSNVIVSTICADGIQEIKGVITCQTDDVNALRKCIWLALTNNNASNRNVFDLFLEENSIERYVETIEAYVR